MKSDFTSKTVSHIPYAILVPVSRKNKLRKFAEVLSFPNVYECYDVQRPFLVGVGMETMELKGQWNVKHFKNNFPITLELACGGGEYAVGLARRFPNRNFIGVDIKGNRLHAGAKDALKEGLENVAFVRTRIEIMDYFFAENEIDEIWITFCDPFPRNSKSNRRLTSDFFHNKYRNVLKQGGQLHLKHDDDDFIHYTLGIIETDHSCSILEKNLDIYAGTLPTPELEIKTLYEGKHLLAGKTIKYLRYTIS